MYRSASAGAGAGARAQERTSAAIRAAAAGRRGGWRPGQPSAPAFDPLRDNARINGFCADRFAPVRDGLAANLATGDDIGAAVAVFIDGEPAVDLWGGYVDSGFTRPWTANTIIATHSVTKTMTAVAALKLADSGDLDLDAPVCRYWPEFGAAGKSGVLVRHLLGHTAGLPGWTADVSWDDVYDLDYSSALLAAQAPWWAPGTAAGYHGMTQGHLVSGVIERITGLTLGRYFAEHVAGPLGADYHIGVGPEHDHRIADFVQATPESIPHGNWVAERVGLNPNLTPDTSKTLAWRRAEIGAANGYGNARSIATVHAALATGEGNGTRFLSDHTGERALEVQSDGVDLVLGAAVTWGLGFALAAPIYANPRGHRCAFWGGNGGHLAYVDFDARMAFAYVVNRWMEGPAETLRSGRLIEAVYRGLARA